MKRLLFITFLIVTAGATSDDDIFLQGIAPDVEDADKIPLFVVPLQPVWNSADAALLVQVGKNLVTLIEEGGPFKVQFHDETKEMRKARDHEARLHKKWLKEVLYTEALLRHRRYGHATSGAARVLRLQSQNAGYLRNPGLFCRSLLIVAQGRLHMGQLAKAKATLKRLAGSCERSDLKKARLVPTKRLTKLLKQALEAVAQEASAEITVTADVPGTKVFLNGRALGNAPVTIASLPPGDHLLGVFRKGFRPWGKKLRLDSGGAVSVEATVTRGLGGEAQQRMLATLRANRVDANVAMVAGRLLKRYGGNAKIGLFGGVAEQNGELWITLYAVDRQGRAKRLKQMKFDPDFLTAHLTLVSVMEALPKLSESFDGGLLAPATLLEKLHAVARQPNKLAWRLMDAKRDGAKAERRSPIRRGPVARTASKPQPTKASSKASSAPQRAPAIVAQKRAKPVTPRPEVASPKPLEETPRAVRLTPKVPPAEPAPEMPAHVDLAEPSAAEEDEIAAEMEALALQEASEASGLTVAQLVRRAETELQQRVWGAMQPDRALEAGVVGAMGLGRAASGGGIQVGAILRAPMPMVGWWAGYGAELFVGNLAPVMSGSDDWDRLRLPFQQETKDQERLFENVRANTSVSLALRGVGRIGRDFASGSTHIFGQVGLGLGAHRSQLLHEQYTVNDDAKKLEDSSITLRASDLFWWAGLDFNIALGAAYLLPQSAWRLTARLQLQGTAIGSVVSFVRTDGEQLTGGIFTGVSGRF